VRDDRRNQRPGEVRRDGIALRLGQVTLEDGLGGPLAELGLEDRSEREPTSRPPPSLPVSLRHRPRRR
jgi:hypothetical protein